MWSTGPLPRVLLLVCAGLLGCSRGGLPDGAVPDAAAGRDLRGADLRGMEPVDQVPGVGLVAWYRFEEAGGPVLDSSGRGHDGAVEGMGVTRGTAGRVGKAISFDGTMGAVRVPAAPDLDFMTGATIELWLSLARPDDLIVAALSLGSKPQPAFGLPTGMTDRSNEYFLSSSTGLAGGVLELTLILSVVIVPLSLYIGLRQELTLASAFEFVPDFLKRVFKELLLAQIFILITGLSLLVVGLAACLIGVLPAAAWVVFAQHQLMAQLYGLHIERGGTAVGAAS